MKVKMSRFAHLAGEHAKRFAKAWDYYCCATGGYLAGYRQAKEDAINAYKNHDVEYGDIPLDSIGEEIIEVEINDGMHQLSQKSFENWEKEQYNKSFKQSLKDFLVHFDFEDIRVEEKDGLISFQGTARKKKDFKFKGGIYG